MRSAIKGVHCDYYVQMASLNPCYAIGKKIKPTHLILHSTGADNPNLKRYVMPDDGFLGENKYGNGWNRLDATTLVHGVIGKNAVGDIECYQIAPWDLRVWGCGAGANGSGNDFCIQIEMCEDRTLGAEYAHDVFNVAVRLYASLCKCFDISQTNIWSHKEAHSHGYASNHGDPESWWKAVAPELTMNRFREAVAVLLSTPSVSFDDVPDDRWSHDSIMKVAEKGWMIGVGGGKFAPSEPVTREQLAVVLDRIYLEGK